jgi:hypothetical protein
MVLNLEKVSGIGKSMAERMKANGIDTVEKLASIKIEDLLKISGIGESTANRYKKQATKMIKEMRAKEKKEKTVVKKPLKIQKPPPRREPYKPQEIQKQQPFKKKQFKKKTQEQGVKTPKSRVETFFPTEVMQKIRFFHFKIKKLEDIFEKKTEPIDLEELNYVLEYVKLLNVNYKTQSQIKIFKELAITPSFHDPLEKREIQIWDLMFECARVLWVLARIYSYISEKFERENKIKDAIIAMTECSKIYKTATYFSSAATRQEDFGKSLSAQHLELNSEDARILAQNLAAAREENKGNLFLASQIYSGLSALSKRLYFLKKHDQIREQHVKAQVNYDMGKACQLKAKALTDSSNNVENEVKINKLKQKSNYYFSKAEDIWENLLKKPDNLIKSEIDNLRVNLSVVNENIIENDVEIVEYNDIKDIQTPEPLIIIPENIGLFLPRSTYYLTKYPAKDMSYDKFKDHRISKLDFGSRHYKMDKLLNRKAGIGRTIKQLKNLYDHDDIDINFYFELLEKYEVKLKSVETSIEELSGSEKESTEEKKKIRQTKIRAYNT